MKKRLVIFTKSYPYKTDESFLLPELDVLQNQFHKIFIVPLLPGSTIKYDLPQTQEVILLKASHSKKKNALFLFFFFCLPLEIKMNFNFRGIFSRLRYNYSYFKKCYDHSFAIEDALKERGVDPHEVFLYSYWLNENALSLALLKKRNNKVYITGRGHGYDVFPEQAKFGYNIFQATIISQMDNIISVSKRGTDFLRIKYPEYASKINTSYLGIPYHNKLNPSDDILRIISCAHVREIKAVHRIPKVLSLLGIPCEWIHIGGFGDQNYKEIVEESVKEALRINPFFKISFTGNLQSKEIFEIYSKTPFTFFISMSKNEGLPVSMMEAASFGIPLFSTNVGGCKELCNTKTGLCFDADMSDEKVVLLINEFIVEIKNNKFPREQVKQFWNDNFCAEKNYNDLISQYFN